MSCWYALNVVKRWLYGLAEQIITSGALTVALKGTFGASHRKPVVGMVTEVLRTIMSSRYQTLAATHHPYPLVTPLVQHTIYMVSPWCDGGGW